MRRPAPKNISSMKPRKEIFRDAQRVRPLSDPFLNYSFYWAS